MNCTQCGSPLSEGSLFCQACGSPVKEQPPVQPAQAPPPAAPAQPQPIYQQPPTQPYAQQPYAPPYTGAPQTKKKRTGLIIGIIAGAVVLIGAVVALYLFVFAGTPLTGQWYCEECGRVLVFSDNNTVTGYALTGNEDATYTYDKGKGKGVLTANDTELSFKVDKNELVFTDDFIDEGSTFVKVDEKKEIEELVLNALQGLWSSEEIGEVLEFKNGKIKAFSTSGDFEGTYDYDIEKGNGSLTVNDKEFEFSADYNALSITGIGNYVKADKKLDIKAFVAEHEMPIAGMWYDASGTYGTIEFYTDGTAQLVMFDQPIPATYTFDVASGTGTFSTESTGQTSEMTFADGTIVIDGITYTQEYVDQMGAQDLQSTVVGTWYEATGTLGDITFYEDGSQLINYNGNGYTGTYTFDPATGSGQVTFNDNGTDTTWDFSISGDVLQIDDTTYTRDYVAPVSASSITGIWYDITGESGTVTLYDDGTCLFDCYGTVLTGTYTFDDTAGTGSLTIDDPSDPLYAKLTLDQGYLYLDTIQYTRDFVQQADY